MSQETETPCQGRLPRELATHELLAPGLSMNLRESAQSDRHAPANWSLVSVSPIAAFVRTTRIYLCLPMLFYPLGWVLIAAGEHGGFRDVSVMGPAVVAYSLFAVVVAGARPLSIGALRRLHGVQIVLVSTHMLILLHLNGIESFAYVALLAVVTSTMATAPYSFHTPAQLGTYLVAVVGAMVCIALVGSELGADEAVRIGGIASLGIVSLLSNMGKSQSADDLRRSEAQSRSLVDHSPFGICTLGRGGRIKGLNRAAWSQLVPPDGSNPVGRPFLDFVANEDRHAVERAIDSAERGGTSMAEFRTDSEDPAVISVRFVALERSDLTEPRAMAIIEDVSQRKRMSASLALADRLATVGVLAAGVAHQINNPLTWILHHLEIIGREIDDLLPDSDDDFSERRARLRAHDLGHLAAEAAGGARRIRNVISDLQSFAGEYSFDNPGRADVNQVIERVVRMVQNEISVRARMKVDLQDCPPVRGSDALLSQVLLNLLLNAAQSIAEGDAQGNEVSIRSHVAEGEVRVEVRDTGCGIDPKHQAHLFLPFFTTRSFGKGAGLGLFVCQNTVSNLGGQIEVKSTVGEGSCFLVRLPLASAADASLTPLTARTQGSRWTDSGCVMSEPGAPAQAGDRGTADRGGSRRPRVLVVDDEPVIALLLARELRGDFDTKTALTGRQARDLIEREGDRLDLVICDLMMSDISGMELHAWMENRRPQLARRTVFITGGAFTQGAQEFVERTRQVVLEKPLDLDLVRRTLRRIAGVAADGAGEDPAVVAMGDGPEAV